MAVTIVAALLIAAPAAFGVSGARPTKSAGRRTSSAPQAPASEDVVLVGFDQGATASVEDRALAAAGAQPLRLYRTGARLVAVPRGRVSDAIAALKADPLVRYAEPDYRSQPAGVPNDPSFPSQWALQNSGQAVNGTSGTAGADEKAASVWNVTTGSRAIVIGEVDTGVDYTHPDLAANIWSNPGGINGCAAGTHGYNVLDSVCDPMDDDTEYGGHGTHVAGIMGAVGNNGIGVTGVNWSTTILPVKWVDSTGDGYTSDLLSALDWLLSAKEAGVNIRVINDSDVFSGTAYSQALSDEIDLLGQNGILFVTAAGNTSQSDDDPSLRRYPCGYDLSTEICVGGTDQSDGLASWSNYGVTSVDLAAPGDNIYSTLRGDQYGFISGASMSAAQVSGAAALVLSADTGLTPVQLKARLLEAADPLSSLAGKVRTGGRLDVCRAVSACGGATAGPAPFSITPPPVTTGASGPEPQAGTPLTAGTGDWDLSPAAYSYTWNRCASSGGSCTSIAEATSSSYTPTASDVGYTLQAVVKASNAAGSTSASSLPTQVVQAAPPAAQTFGKTTVGASSGPATADFERVDSFPLTTAARVSNLTVYLDRASSGSQTFRGIIYADSGGTPAGLLATSTQLTFGSSTKSGWFQLAFTSPVSLPAGTYWIGVQAGATSNVVNLRYDEAGRSSGDVASAPYASGPPDPFPAGTLQTEQISIYATFVAQGNPTTTTTSSTTTTTTAPSSTTTTTVPPPSTTSSTTTTTTSSTTTTTVPPPSTTSSTTTTTVPPTITTSTTTTQPVPPQSSVDDCAFETPTVGISAMEVDQRAGYFVASSSGQVCARGAAVWHGDLSGARLAAPVIAIQATSDGAGYWLLGADGGVFSYGDARFYGSTGSLRLNAPVVGMAVTPDDRGYWIVAKDGGIFSFGDAHFHGSTGNVKLVKPVDGMAVAPGGNGYWLVAADGGVFTFTPDGFYGSLGNVRLSKPIVGMSSTPAGRGYTLVGSDGGVFSFGDASFVGSLAGDPPTSPVVGLSPSPGDEGYYLVTQAGGVYALGSGTRFSGNA